MISILSVTREVCSHSRVHDLFIESLYNSTQFIGQKCASYGEIYEEKCSRTGMTAFMGGDKNNMEKAFGVYHLLTNGESPFAIGNKV